MNDTSRPETNREVRDRKSFLFAWISLGMTSLVACLLWWAYLLPIKNMFPHADDVNFFIPLWMRAEELGLWPTMIQPQGPHFHFQYKLISGLQLYLGEYNPLIYTVLGPITLCVVCGLILKWLSSVQKPVGKPIQILSGVAIALLIFAPYRFVDLSYDMVALGGSLFLLAQIFLIIKIDGFVKTGKGLLALAVLAVVASLGIGVSSFKTFFASICIAIILVNLFQAKRVSVPLGLSATGLARNSLTKRSAIVVGLIVICWLSYDVFLAMHFKPEAGTGTGLITNLPLIFSDAINVSLGGDRVYAHMELSEYQSIIHLAFGLLVLVLCLWLVPKLSAGGHILPIVLMGSAAFSAIGGYLLRETSDIPRYAGSYSLLWLGLGLGLLIFLGQKRDMSDDPVRETGGLNLRQYLKTYLLHPSATLLSVMFTIAMIGYASERWTARPFITKYYDNIDAIYLVETESLSDAEIKRVCQTSRPQCEAVIKRIQQLRSINTPTPDTVTP